MKACEAKKLTSEAAGRAREAIAHQIKAVRELWDGAIKKAASEGLNMVHESDLPKLRMPLSAQAFKEAAKLLEEDGFTVRPDAIAGKVTVSW